MFGVLSFHGHIQIQMDREPIPHDRFFAMISVSM